MKKFIEKLTVATIVCFTLAFCFGCALFQKDEYTGFLVGAAKEVPIAEMVLLNEIVDTPDEGEATLTVSKDDYEEDLTGSATWTPFEAGKYLFTLVVTGGKYAGTYFHEITVTTNVMMWSHYNGALTYLYDTNLQFTRLFANLNLSVDSAYEWTPFVKSVRIGSNTFEIDENSTYYRIESMEPHFFTYGVRAENGEELKDVVRVNVVYSTTSTDLYLNTLSEGTYTIAVEGVQSVVVNGEVCQDFTVSENSVAIDKTVLYEKYEGVNFISMQTTNGEVRDTLNVYTELCSMEGYPIAPSFLTLHSGNMTKATGATRLSNKYATDGSTSLETEADDYYWPQYVINMTYLDMIFENPQVTAFIFDMTYAGSNESFTECTLTSIGGHAAIVLQSGVSQQIVLTRAQYEATKISEDVRDAYGWRMTMQNTRDRVGGTEKSPKIYFDNFRAVTQLPSKALRYDENVTGTYELEIASVSKASLNGEEIPSDKLTVSADKIAIDKAWLMGNVGKNQLELIVGTQCFVTDLSVYYTEYDFENIAVENVGFISWYDGYSNAQTDIVTYGDSKAIRLYTAGGQWPAIKIDGDWMDMVFADESVGSFVFDVTLDNCAKDEMTHRWFNSNVAPSTKVLAGQWASVSVTRTAYETWKTKVQAGTEKFPFLRVAIQNQSEHPGGTSPHALVFDNFRTMPANYITGEDFESGTVSVGDFIQWFSTGVTCNRAIVDWNSSKALRLHIGPTSYPQFWLSAEWLAKVFADTKVTKLSFEITLSPNDGTEFTSRDMAFSTGLGGNGFEYIKFYPNETKTFELTREKYQSWLSTKYDEKGFRMQISNSESPVIGMQVIFDNFVISRAA